MLEYGLLLIAYLIGSIPFSVIVGKVFCKIDVRDHGSGNPGTTNAFRVLGRKWGMLVFFCDVTKGGIVVLLARLSLFGGIELLHPLTYGFAAAFGHVFPIYLKFKGGKAVATSAGALTAYVPLLATLGMTSYLVTLKTTRYVSLSSCAAALAMFIGSFLVYFFGPDKDSGPAALSALIGHRGDYVFLILTSVGSLTILLRHIKNFKNIARGVEPKSDFMQKKTS